MKDRRHGHVVEAAVSKCAQILGVADVEAELCGQNACWKPSKEESKEANGSVRWDKVWKRENLQSALRRVVENKGAAGVDGQKAEPYLRESPRRLEQVQEMLRKGQYTPQPVKRVWIPKLGSKELRPLGVPAVEDRVVQTAVRNVIEPIFENIFAEHSYGFRPPTRGQNRDCLRGSTSTARRGPRLGGGCRPQRLLRFDSAG